MKTLGGLCRVAVVLVMLCASVAYGAPVEVIGDLFIKDPEPGVPAGIIFGDQSRQEKACYGTVTSVGAGFGLTGGPITTTGALAVDFTGSSGAVNTAARSDHTHNYDAGYVNVGGDVMTGALTLPANGLVAGATQLVLNSGNVGIGIAVPAEKLHLVGNLKMDGDIKTDRWLNSDTNTFIGVGAGSPQLSHTQLDEAWYNTGIGYLSLSENTTGYYNVALGGEALHSNKIGAVNTALGQRALYLNDSGNGNVAVGMNSLSHNFSGGNNTGVGANTLSYNETGSYNTAVGQAALRMNTGGSSNTSVGHQAGYYSLGNSNVFMGYRAGYTEAGSSRLHIANSEYSTLIYGQFDTKRVCVDCTNPVTTLDVNGPVTVRTGDLKLSGAGSGIMFPDGSRQTTANQDWPLYDGRYVNEGQAGSVTKAMLAPECSAGQILKMSGGVWSCANDNDTITTYTAGTGLSLSGTVFSVAVPLALIGDAPAGPGGTLSVTNTGSVYGSMALYGRSTALAGTAYGVWGQNDSDDGAGVYGEASGTGVWGKATSRTGTTRGVHGDSDSDSGTGVYGYTSALTGTTYGVKGESMSTGGTGVYGYTAGLTGTTYGVYGLSKSTSGTGVYGYANAASGTTYGVYGKSDSPDGRGVYGVAMAQTGAPAGVYGFAYSNGYAGLFNGRVYVNGALTATTKSFVQPHAKDPSKEIVYIAAEAPEAMVIYRGTARLIKGKAVIQLPEHFSIVAAEQGIQVQVTPHSADTYGLAVVERGRERIVVKELRKGKGSFSFDYLVTAVRAGFEGHQPVAENTHFRPTERESVAEFEKRYQRDDMNTKALREMMIANGILTEDGKLNRETVARLGWTVKEADLAEAR